MSERIIYLIGIGTGVYEGLTIKAAQILSSCDLFFGAERMLAAADSCSGKKINTYKPDEILDYLKQNDNGEWRKACILLSGDVGFYSGARKLLTVLSDYRVELVPGISSISAFCAALGISWDETAVASLHGRQMNVIARADTSKYTFCLLNGAESVRELADKLIYYDFDNVTLHIGESIGYPDEKIVHLTPKEALETGFGKLLVTVIENPSPRACTFPEIADEEFIRGAVPMTKSEVRSIGIQKLGLSKASVLYDIGAGTGSVGIQAAVCYPDSSVYAVEYKEEAAELITQNRKKFRADNLKVILGRAPEALSGLPAPTHAFIGGSSGSIKEILELLWEKNPHTVVVISLITLETLSEVMNIIEAYGIEPEIVQINVSKAKKAGKYHLMMGQNPVTLIKLAP